ncbi:MAG: peptidylprolyl isomerase [Porticoccaceae bacterium]|nr:peptidylprolyl isomerase [Porticoccaceae bacterium]
MLISSNKVVTVHYILSDDNQNVIENTYDIGKPTVYLHGRNQMVRGFEANLSKATEGQKLSFILMPADAYGLKNINNTQRIPIKYLKHEGKLTSGKQIKVNTDSGVRQGTIIKVGKFNADVDMNHPLAGKNLHFEVEVIDIRDATNSEISHGHVHSENDCGH